MEISPFIGINTMFAKEYFDNIRLNASFDRHFEPAPERNFYGGIGIRYNFDQQPVGLRNNILLFLLPAGANFARQDIL